MTCASTLVKSLPVHGFRRPPPLLPPFWVLSFSELDEAFGFSSCFPPHEVFFFLSFYSLRGLLFIPRVPVFFPVLNSLRFPLNPLLFSESCHHCFVFRCGPKPHFFRCRLSRFHHPRLTVVPTAPPPSYSPTSFFSLVNCKCVP